MGSMPARLAKEVPDSPYASKRAKILAEDFG